MSALETRPRQTLDLVREISVAGRGDITPSAFLDDVCAVISDGFGFDHVTAVRFHPDAEEVSEITARGGRSAHRTQRRPIADAPLLAEALENEALAFAPGDERYSWGFALPLIGPERCHGFLSGSRDSTSTPAEGELDALAAVGVIVSTLFDNAVSREEAQQLDVLKSEFIALAAHELRSPLSSIYGISVTLDERGDTVPESTRSALRDALREQTVRMRHLIEQLLDLSRFDLVAIRVSPERVHLHPKVEELVRAHTDTRAEVNNQVPSDLEAVVDPVGLDRMLSNLIANALRYGAPPVTVTAARRDTHFRLAVEDRGEGVPPDFVPVLFDRFTRGRESRRGSDGSGLGLAIAQAYARAHGGEVVYTPAVPQGARFEIVLPLTVAERGEGGES